MRLVYRRRRIAVLVVAIVAVVLSVAMLCVQTVTALDAIAGLQGRSGDGSQAASSASFPAPHTDRSGGADETGGAFPSGSASDDSNQRSTDKQSAQDGSGDTGGQGSANSGNGGQNAQTAAQAAAVDWRSPSGGTQPDLSALDDLSVTVSVADQRVSVLSGGRTVYTMVASTGMDGTTPTGDFVIGARGDHFYNPTEGMGADYWVAFLGTTYLFHSVPTYENMGDYIEQEALKLGRPASHGCVRLTVADAQWLYGQLPEGTPVHIG